MGMLIDHGIDAFTIVFFGIVSLRFMNIGKYQSIKILENYR
jgi:hypothetical protein